MNRNEVEKKLADFLQKNHPQALDEFNISVNPLTAPDPRSSVQIQNLVKAIYTCFIRGTPTNCSDLYILIRMFAGAFEEDELIKEMDMLWGGLDKKGRKKEIPLPTIEALILRDIYSMQFRIRHKYNYGHGKIYALGDLYQTLIDSKKRFMCIFNEIYIKNDLAVPLELPSFMPSGAKDAMQL